VHGLNLRVVARADAGDAVRTRAVELGLAVRQREGRRGPGAGEVGERIARA